MDWGRGIISNLPILRMGVGSRKVLFCESKCISFINMAKKLASYRGMTRYVRRIS